ncbi:hypothetical protein G3I19_11680 [Streptomyces sp. SID10853]|uniref:hypothetical protein n=1 Tax=Streptomyces sp. SID10853 TaxID=2706028 RepID=UPI0013C1C151|nr:hypothetical protein [Streptomyces sp. SID10853]NDZ79162.1 hypothetical protein [Streptomyces sp. SID10853]
MSTTPQPDPTTAPPLPGTAVRDIASSRVGIVMGHEGPWLQLRPLGGGREWDADPARVRPVGPAELLQARVAEANARSRSTD